MEWLESGNRRWRWKRLGSDSEGLCGVELDELRELMSISEVYRPNR